MSAGRRPTDRCMESWLSGLRRTTGNRVTANTRSRVQIPNSPPWRKPRNLRIPGFLFCSSGKSCRRFGAIAQLRSVSKNALHLHYDRQRYGRIPLSCLRIFAQDTTLPAHPSKRTADSNEIYSCEPAVFLYFGRQTLLVFFKPGRCKLHVFQQQS